VIHNASQIFCNPVQDQGVRQASSVAVDVSVIVVNWNRGDLLSSCLRSLAAQKGIGSFEVIIVDNGSTDNSHHIMEEFKKSSGLSVCLIFNARNHGFCAANNQGIHAARGEYIALLNNDAEADREWLHAMWSELRDRPDFGMIASKILVYEDPRKIDKAGHLIYLDGQNRGRGSGEIDRGQYDRLEEVLWPDGCAALYRKAMLDEIGGFDEDLFAYGDDAELGLRARIAGWRCLYVPSAVVRHHRGSTLGLLSSRRLELIERNRLLLALKHFPLSLLWLNGFYWLARVAAGVSAAFLGRGESARFPGIGGKLRLSTAILTGFGKALALAPRTLRKRRSLRPLRRLSPKQIRQLLFQYRISLKTISEQAI
jgi:GT2 family glycosyltransferase